MNGGTDDYSGWLSMRELDEATGLQKGAAFRAFKALLATLEEGRDFVVLDQRSAEGLAASLRVRGRLYRSSVAPVLLSAPAAARVRQAMLAGPGSAAG